MTDFTEAASNDMSLSAFIPFSDHLRRFAKYRMPTLFGLREALEGGGKRPEATKTYLQFGKARAHADADLPEIRRAKETAQSIKTVIRGIL